MNGGKTWVNGLVFFWLLGWICIGPAIGADNDESDLFDDQVEEDVDDLQESSVNVHSFGRIDIAIQDQDIGKVLQMLAIQSQRNILPSPEVQGSISAALYGVDFYEALDAILHTNGFGYVEEGSFIRVYTAAELAEREARNRRPVTKVVTLNWLRATEAGAFVEQLLTPDVGTITINEKPVPGIVPTASDVGDMEYALQDKMIIRDYPEVIEEIEALLKQLDVRPKQVQIEATILEARLTEDNAFGVDLSLLVDFDLDEFASPLSIIPELSSGSVGNGGQAAQTSVGNALNGDAGVRIGILSNNVAAFVRALDQVTDTTVLARPKVLALNRQDQKLIAGEKLGYISTTQTAESTTQTVEFLEVGTQMNVRPFLNDEGYIRLELRLEISEGEVRGDQGFVIPDESTSELIGNVIVPNGKTIVLGGLFKEDTSISRKRVPVAADFPLIGDAFKGQDDTVSRSEVIFLIRPTVIRDESLIAVSNRVREDMENVQLGVREGLLPWSRSKQTAIHVRDAHDLLGQGMKDRAMMSINMALRLDPSASEAMRMKQELTQQRLYWPDKGILNDAIEEMVDWQLEAQWLEQSRAAAAATLEDDEDDEDDNDAVDEQEDEVAAVDE